MKDYSSEEILDILKNHKATLLKYKVKRIGLFGSFSRNESSEKGDIDLLVEFHEKNFDNFIELAFELEKIFGKKIDLVTKEGMSQYILPYIQNEVKWYEAR